MDEATRETGHRRLLGGLVQLARTCHAALDSARLMEAIMDCLLGLCKAERGFILAAVQPSGREAALIPGKGDFVAVVTRKINPTGSDAFSRTLASRVLATGKPLLIEDTSADGNLNTQESVLAAQIRSVLAAPLLKGNAAVGVIYLDCHSARRVFSQEDLHVLEAAAEHVVGALEVSRERDRLRRQTACLQQVVGEEVRREYDFHRIVGKSAAMVKVLEAASAVAPQDTTVLILGESGTGKELIARAIHDLSRRCQGLFVAVNCMALASSVLESELFGHEKGAFTGATARHVGRFEVADGGTIFLDEIGELDPGIQVKLLRVLQEGVIERVGSSSPRPISVRLVCATNVDLKKAVATGKFRDDLYYRINVFPIALPPLREHKDDIAPLVEHFIGVFAARMGRPIRGIDPQAFEALRAYDWPGNVRELKNVVERAFVLERSDRITPGSLPFLPASEPFAAEARPAQPLAGLALAEARDAFEKGFILDSLRRHKGNISQAAQELQVPRSTIYRKLQAWGVAVPGATEE